MFEQAQCPVQSLKIHAYSATQEFATHYKKVFLGISNTITLIKLLLLIEHIFRYSVNQMFLKKKLQKVSHIEKTIFNNSKVYSTFFFIYNNFIYSVQILLECSNLEWDWFLEHSRLIL